MKTLILSIPPSWPEHSRACSWWLRDEARVLARGHGEPARWPGIADGAAGLPCEILLGGPQTACQTVRLPRTARGRSPEILAAALEDGLLGNPAQLHFACADDAAPDETQAVACVSRERLAGIVGLLRELGLEPRAAWPLGMLLPAGEAWLDEAFVDVGLGCGTYLGLDGGAPLADWLPHLSVNAWRQVDERQAPAPLPGVERLSGPLPMPRVPAGSGFLYGALAPRRRRLVEPAHFRPALRLAAACAVLLLLVSMSQWAWLTQRATHLQDDIVAVFRQTTPNSPIVAPLLQMQRAVDDARRQVGRLADDDYLRLLAPLAMLSADEAASVEELRYAEGRLQMTARLPAATGARLAEESRRLGLTLAGRGDGQWTLAPGGLR